MTTDLSTRAAPNRGTPWTEKEESLLGTATDRELAAKLGRTASGVMAKRLALGIAAHESRARIWSKHELKLLGKMPDEMLARLLSVSRKHVFEMRERRGIKPFGKTRPDKQK